MRNPNKGPRGASNANERGNTHDRKVRRAYLIEKHGIPRKSDGKKTRIRCFHCGQFRKAEGATWEVDRWPICGHLGGRYTRNNIVPSCCACNKRCANRAACERRVAKLMGLSEIPF